MRSSALTAIAGVMLATVVGRTVAGDPSPSGFLEGHLKITSMKEVELAGAPPSKSEASNYAEYPLIVLSKADNKEVARVTADEQGNYRIALPPGNYVLDLDLEGRGRERSRIRAKSQPFTIASNETVHVD